jgi:5-methylcytosine-specific restriction endonuclease McrA
MPEAPDLKTCLGCGRELLATRENFAIHKMGRGGLNPRCKACKNAATSARYHADIEASRAEKRQVAVRSYYRHHDANKAKARALRKAERADDSERAKHASESKARYAACDKAEYAAQVKAYRAANPAKSQAWHRNDKARRKQAVGTHTAADALAQLAKQNGLCFWCSKTLTKYHVDHYVPLAKGGTNWPDNIVCACARCNLQKGTKLPEEFRKPA